MGTRSNIQVEIAPGKSLAIYAHWDGYPSHMGKMLLNHYNTQEKAEELVRLGDVSSVKPTLDQCQFYKRDRKESGDEIEPHEVDTFKISHIKQGQEWQYQFTKGRWFVDCNTGNFQMLTQELIDDDGEGWF